MEKVPGPDSPRNITINAMSQSATPRRVLIISYYWPPAGGPGVQRVLKFAKYLPVFGWEATILTVKSGEYQAFDNSLISDINAEQKIFKTGSIGFYGLFKKISGQKSIPTHQLSGGTGDTLFARISRWIRLNLVLPDGRIGWYPFAVRKGRDIIDKEKIDLVFSSGPPHSVHLIGRSLAKTSSCPWVADFRDPWSERFYYEENKRSWLARLVELRMEKAVMKKASAITAASSGFIQLLLAKTGEFEKGSVITNGFDQDDFSDMTDYSFRDPITILHIGNLTKSQLPLSLFKVLQKQLNQTSGKYKLKLTGSVHPEIRQAVSDHNLNEIVEYNPYLKHDLAVKEMQQADFVFTVIPDTANNSGIIPGKIFEYMKSETAIILIGPADCDAAAIINKTSSGRVFDYDTEAELAEYIKIRRNEEVKDMEQFNRFTLTEELVKIFNAQL